MPKTFYTLGNCQRALSYYKQWCEAKEKYSNDLTVSNRIKLNKIRESAWFNYFKFEDEINEIGFDIEWYRKKLKRSETN